MPLPPLISSRSLGPLRRQDEVPVGRRQPDHHPGARRPVEKAGDPALRMRLDGDLDAVGRVLGAGGGVAARVAHALDLDRQADELSGAEALPVLVRAQGQRDAVGCLAPDLDDLGPRLVQRPRGADQLQVAVDAVRRGERLEQRPSRGRGVRTGARAAAARAAAAVGMDLSEQLCTEYPRNRASGYPISMSVRYVTLATCTTVLPLRPAAVSESRRERKQRTRADLLQAALLLLKDNELRQPQPARGQPSRPVSSRPPSTGTSRAWRSSAWRSSRSPSGPCAR